VAHELTRLRESHPDWHVWASAQGRLYATGAGMSATVRGASVTVDSVTPDGLRAAITAAELDSEAGLGGWTRRLQQASGSSGQCRAPWKGLCQTASTSSITP
jgi:hypothetical protein